MTVRMRLRRWARTQGKRRAAARTKRSAAAGSRRREQQPSGASQLRFLRLTVCGALFVSLVLLKLVLPGNLSAFRGTLAQWLVRDADFTEAFSAIGHAVAAPERFAESLGNAYVAVFGGSGMQDAAEVGGGAEIAQPDGTNEEDAAAKPLPDYVLDAQPTLPFSYVSPLDGARALCLALSFFLGPATGERITAAVSLACSLALCALGLKLSLGLHSGWLFAFAAFGLLWGTLRPLGLARGAKSV